MSKQNANLLWLYKEYIKIFNNWETEKSSNDYLNFDDLVCVFHKLTDILERNKVIEKYGIKHYKVIENGEII